MLRAHSQETRPSVDAEHFVSCLVKGGSYMTLSYAILSGAGFSKDWGGFLVKDMTFRIFSSSLMTDPTVRSLLAKTANYEKVLERFQKAKLADRAPSPKSEASEKILMDAVLDAYHFQESMLWFNSSHSPNIDLFFGKIVLPAKMAGTFRWYTLNHDLLLEKKIIEGKRIYCPGVETARPTRDFSVIDQFRPEEPLDPVRDADNSITYVKLHGSINWRNPVNNLPVIVAGGGKLLQIRGKPGPAGQLIDSYWNSFCEGVGRGTTVLTIGYSFGDEHVNEILARDGVRIFNINPIGFPDIVGPTETQKGVARNILGVWPSRLSDLIGNGLLPKEPYNRYMDDLAEKLGLA